MVTISTKLIKINALARGFRFVGNHVFAAMLAIGAGLVFSYADNKFRGCEPFTSISSMMDSVYVGMALQGATYDVNNPLQVKAKTVLHKGFEVERIIEPLSLSAIQVHYRLLSTIISPSLPGRYNHSDIGLPDNGSIKVFRYRGETMRAIQVSPLCSQSAVHEIQGILDTGLLKFFESVDEYANNGWLVEQ